MDPTGVVSVIILLSGAGRRPALLQTRREEELLDGNVYTGDATVVVVVGGLCTSRTSHHPAGPAEDLRKLNTASEITFTSVSSTCSLPDVLRAQFSFSLHMLCIYADLSRAV